MRNEDDRPFWYVVTAVLIVVLAAAVRFSHLTDTLVEDEVWVATVIRGGLLRPHSYPIPPLFYEILRAWGLWRGFTEVTLREPAAALGVLLAALPFFAPLPRLTRIVWSLLLAFSSPFLFYSQRVKQYTLEAAAATLLLILFLHAMRTDRRRWWIAFFAVAGVSVLTMHTPVFVVAAMGAAMLLSDRRRWSLTLAFLGMGALAVVAYVTFSALGPETARIHGNLDAWFGATGRWVSSPASFLANTKHWLGQAFNLTSLWWLAVVPLCAIWVVRTRDRVLITVAVLPPLFALAGSIVRFYPYGEVRLMLFCFPALYLVVAEALTLSAQRFPLLLVLVVPFVFRGVACDPYNATYMHVYDLRVVYDTVANDRAARPIYADPWYAGPLAFHHPELAPRLHAIAVGKPAGPGWYLQRKAAFDAAGASIRVVEHEVIAARVD